VVVVYSGKSILMKKYKMEEKIFSDKNL